MTEGQASVNQPLLAALRFDERGLVPVLLEDYRTRRTLAIEWLSRAALEKTIETRTVHVEHPNTKELVVRGGQNRRATVEGIQVECEGRCLLLRVFQHVGACHRGYTSCFYRAYDVGHREIVRLEDPVFRGD